MSNNSIMAHGSWLMAHGSRAIFNPSRIIPLIILTILALFGTSYTRAEAGSISVAGTENGSVSVFPNEFESGIETTVEVTFEPEVGYKVASATFSYATEEGGQHNGDIDINDDDTGSFEIGDNAAGDATVTVTFEEDRDSLKGGPTADEAVPIDDNTKVTLWGGHYKVNSNITFNHDIKLRGDVTITFVVDGETTPTMTMNGLINGKNSAGSLTVNGYGTLSSNSNIGNLFTLRRAQQSIPRTALTLTA